MYKKTNLIVSLMVSLISLPLFGSDIGLSLADRFINEFKELDTITDPMRLDTVKIWKLGEICDQMAMTQDERTETYLDTLDLYTQNSDWHTSRGIYYKAYGIYYDIRGNRTKALEYYDKAIDLLSNSQDDLDIAVLAFTYVKKAFLLSNSNMYLECKKVIEKGLPYARKTTKRNMLAMMVDWLGDYYYYDVGDTINYKKALSYYKQVEEMHPEIENILLIADNHAVLSGCYERLGEISKSKYHFKIADSISQAQNLLFVRRGLYADKARLLEKNGKDKEANAIYVQIAEFLKGNKNIEFQARAESDLWRSYKKIGNYELALKHYEEWTWMEDSLANQDVAIKYAELEKKYDIAQKENEIITLENKESKTRMNFLLLLGGVSLLGLVFILRRNTQLSKSKQLLITSYKISQEATFKGEQNERSRIASELHDNVNSKIAAIKWQLESIIPTDQQNQKVLKSSIDLIESTYQDVRQISHNLVPLELEEVGLEKAVESLVYKLNETGDIQFEVNYAQRLPNVLKSKAYPIYNITLELINNILRHAKASNAVVTIEQKDTDIKLVVEDDGQGYDQSREEKGFGLNSIQERVKSLRGNLNVESIIGKGTRVEILIPV